MSKNNIDIEIDQLSNSIENSITGEIFDTEVRQLQHASDKSFKPAEWLFDWQAEINLPNRQIYKLTTVNNPGIIHGLISDQLQIVGSRMIFCILGHGKRPTQTLSARGAA